MLSKQPNCVWLHRWEKKLLCYQKVTILERILKII
jgi:hypothetical protein